MSSTLPTPDTLAGPKEKLPTPATLEQDPWDELATPEHAAHLTESAFKNTPAHKAAREERIKHLGEHLSEKEREQFHKSGHYLTDDELMEMKKEHVKEFLETVGKIGKTIGAKGIATAAEAGRAARGWYRTATKTIFHLFNSPDDAFRFTALLAATSPRTSVDSNLKLALDIFHEWNRQGRPWNTPEQVKAWLQGLDKEWKAQGKTFKIKGDSGEVTSVPWAGNPAFGSHMNNVAHALLYDGKNWTHEFKLSGNKVNAFYQNLIGNLSHSTNDTWMAHLGNISQSLFAKPVSYQAFSSVVRQAASILNESLSPGEKPWAAAEVQETAWSFIRTLAKMQGFSQLRKNPITSKEALQTITHGHLADSVNFVSELVSNPDVDKRVRQLGLGKELDRLRQVFQQISERKAATTGERAAPSLNPILEAISKSAGRHAAIFATGRIKHAAGEGKIVNPLSPFLRTMFAFLHAN